MGRTHRASSGYSQKQGLRLFLQEEPFPAAASENTLSRAELGPVTSLLNELIFFICIGPVTENSHKESPVLRWKSIATRCSILKYFQSGVNCLHAKLKKKKKKKKKKKLNSLFRKLFIRSSARFFPFTFLGVCGRIPYQVLLYSMWQPTIGTYRACTTCSCYFININIGSTFRLPEIMQYIHNN